MNTIKSVYVLTLYHLPWIFSCDQLIFRIPSICARVKPEFCGDVIWVIRELHVVPWRVVSETTEAGKTHLCPGKKILKFGISFLSLFILRLSRD